MYHFYNLRLVGLVGLVRLNFELTKDNKVGLRARVEASLMAEGVSRELWPPSSHPPHPRLKILVKNVLPKSKDVSK